MIGLGLMIRTLVTVVEGVGSCTVVMAMTMNCDCCSVLVGYLLNNKCKCKRYGRGKSDSQSLAERLQMLSSRKRERYQYESVILHIQPHAALSFGFVPSTRND